MSDDPLAFSPIMAPPAPTPAGLQDSDYEAICAAVMETTRGRWFLQEFTRRNRNTDTRLVLAAIERIEAAIRGERGEPRQDNFRFDLMEMAKAIARTKAEIAAIKPEGEHDGKIGGATVELDSIVHATETATSDILAAAERIQEMAWSARERAIDPNLCDDLDSRATEIYTACSFQDLTGQRIQKVVQVMRYLESRLSAMVDIWDGDSNAASGAPAVDASASPPPPEGFAHTGLDQTDIDGVMDPAAAATAKSMAAEEPSAMPQPDTAALTDDQLAEAEADEASAFLAAEAEVADSPATDSAADEAEGAGAEADADDIVVVEAETEAEVETAGADEVSAAFAPTLPPVDETTPAPDEPIAPATLAALDAPEIEPEPEADTIEATAPTAATLFEVQWHAGPEEAQSAPLAQAAAAPPTPDIGEGQTLLEGLVADAFRKVTGEAGPGSLRSQVRVAVAGALTSAAAATPAEAPPADTQRPEPPAAGTDDAEPGDAGTNAADIVGVDDADRAIAEMAVPMEEVEDWSPTRAGGARPGSAAGKTPAVGDFDEIRFAEPESDAGPTTIDPEAGFGVAVEEQVPTDESADAAATPAPASPTESATDTLPFEGLGAIEPDDVDTLDDAPAPADTADAPPLAAEAPVTAGDVAEIDAAEVDGSPSGDSAAAEPGSEALAELARAAASTAVYPPQGRFAQVRATPTARPAPQDPLAAIVALTDEEKIALFS